MAGPEPSTQSGRWRGMPDATDNRSASSASPDPNGGGVAQALISAASRRTPMPAPGLSDPATARLIRDQVVAHLLGQGAQRLGYRLADGVVGILTDAMQFTGELVVPGDRLIAAAARPALAFRLARAVASDTPAADLPATLGAVALAIDLGDSRIDGATSEADRIADNGGTGCFVVGPWRAITASFADRELILERNGERATSSAALFIDPMGDALALLRRCQRDGDLLSEGSILLLVGKSPPLTVRPGASLVLAAGEIGTVTAEIGG